MAASVIGTGETFLERSNSFSQVQINSYETKVEKMFHNMNQSKIDSKTALIDSENAITLVSSTQNNIKSELNENTENILISTQTEMIFDDNSSSSSSTSSSKSRKRKRENEILQRDLVAFGVSVKSEPHTPNSEGKDGAKEQSPASRLRPRRNVSSNYGSCSPIFMSPVKKSSKKNSILNAVEAAKNLQAFLNVDEESMNSIVAPHFDEPEFVPEELKIHVPMVRSFKKSIVRELDVSVFAELISPLELTSGHVYPNNYVSLKIIDRKPMRNVCLNIKSKQYNQIPMMELRAIDLNDRFELGHSQGIFDNPQIKQASKTPLSIYLFGTYAEQAQEMVKDDDVLGIVKFRTVALFQGDEKSSIHNLRKRNSKNDDDESIFSYSYSILVDSLSDLEMISSSKKIIKQDQNDNDVKIINDKSDNELEKMFNDAIRLDEPFEDKWAPFLSFCQSWRAPDDPKNLNQSLYIFQPCVPKFESASSTVKM